MNFIDSFLNRITMYRLMLYGLSALAVYAGLMSIAGILPYRIASLAASWILLVISCWAAQTVFAKLFRAVPNIESVWITAFILFFTIAPVANTAEAILVCFAGVLAMASKYYLAIKKKHIFNPAAFALAVLSFTGTGLAAWWIAAPVTLPAVLVVGLLVVRKIRRFDVFWAFLATCVLVSSLYAAVTHTSIAEGIEAQILSWPLVFLATIMLTEPLTMPPSRGLRIVFGIIVGALFSSQFHIGSLYVTPQLALLVGNIYAYLVSSRQKLMLRFASMIQQTPNVYEFVFTPNQTLAFTPGQYLEWTLPHKNPDDRGNRRYFTIASSPEDQDIKLGVRIDAAPSTFKKKLRELTIHDTLSAGALAGDFVMPQDREKKLVFIAGGIGVTPFISMIRHMLSVGEKRDIALFYAANTEADFAYRELFEEAKTKLGIRVILTTERITEAMIVDVVPDFRNYLFYISGPNAMVQNYKKMLRGLSIAQRNIKTDYFPGF